MNTIKFTFVALICWFTTINVADAHIAMVYPAGGEIFMPGSEINIEWRRLQQHAQLNWDLSYSSDGGVTWQSIRMNLPDDVNKDVFTYLWTVPKTTTPTMTGRIRIVQDNTGMNYEAKTLDFTIEAVAVAVERPGELPVAADLVSAYPNPFSSSAVIEFRTSGAEHVSVEVFDIQGKKVAVLLNRFLSSGLHTVKWSADGNPAGVYIYRITSGDFVKSQTILLVR